MTAENRVPELRKHLAHYSHKINNHDKFFYTDEDVS